MVTTLFFATITAPTPAAAVITCAGDAGPAIDHTNGGAGYNESIFCVNTKPRTGGPFAIGLGTDGLDRSIYLNSSGDLTATYAAGTSAITAFSYGSDSPLTITSSGDITATSLTDNANGILAYTRDALSPVNINNSGDIAVRGGHYANGIFGRSNGDYSPVNIVNSGDIAVNAPQQAFGIFMRGGPYNGSPISIVNTGDIQASGSFAFGILANTVVTPTDPGGAISVVNSGDIAVTGAVYALGIFAQPAYGPAAGGSNAPLSITNSGDITAIGGVAGGIYATNSGVNSPLSITNSGDITAIGGGRGVGIRASTVLGFSPLTIENSGNIIASGAVVDAIDARTYGPESPVRIVNSGTSATVGSDADNIRATTAGVGSSISIVNSGDIKTTGSHADNIRETTSGAGSPISIVNSGNIATTGFYARGLNGTTDGAGSPISIVNRGTIGTTGTIALGVAGMTNGSGSPLNIVNRGTITTTGSVANAIQGTTDGAGSLLSIVNSGRISTNALGIYAAALGAGSRNLLTNSGSLSAGTTGILAVSFAGTTIVNSGDISASSDFAIGVSGGAANIYNTGTITGFVALDANDKFINQAGGTFEARQTSDFDAYGTGGNDLFRSEAGGLVHTADNANAAETTQFIHLETFQNQGTISTVDGGVGDVFTISNTPGGTDLNFNGSGGSTLAVDAFLGGPGSTADNFVVEGNVSGSTTVAVNNTNTGPGVFNPVGIPVVFVTGNTPTGNEFSLAKPIDTGFFDYDLFFTPTGSGFWSLKSFPGGGAHLLPQLETAAQDIWHEGSSTWFDRTTDLRVLLNGGATTTAYDPGGKSLSAAPSGNVTPAVWARGSGGWLDRNDSASTSAYGRTYNYNLDRNLQTMDFQMGLDLGKRDVLSQGDALVFGVLGGFVQANLDYDHLVRQFDFNGGQVGAYATYLKGGLFVDTLFNAHLYELNPNATVGFPNSLNASTLGVRTDTGYRFGSFSGGAFLEPLATIEVMWANIDGFSLGGNTVSFNDDPNVRGRLGLRAGTTMQAWAGTMMEPFVIGSLWGNLSDNNQATLVSTGNTFRYQDNLQDAWGEVSAGVNFFNFSQTTSVFAKADVSFGDDLTGVGGKAGMRVVW